MGACKSRVSGLMKKINDLDGYNRFETILYDATGGGENDVKMPGLSYQQITKLLSILTPIQLTELEKELDYQTRNANDSLVKESNITRLYNGYSQPPLDLPTPE